VNELARIAYIYDALELEEFLRSMDGSVTELPITEHLVAGLYSREVRIPADTVLVGEIHRTAHINILAKGSITVFTEDGEKYLEAPATVPAPALTKRVGLTHSDVVWISVHQTDLTNIEDVKASLVIDADELLALEPHELEKIICLS